MINENRERLSSRIGFILMAAGCSIGCGNVWKFPWMCGQYGGGSFVLIYLLCLVLLGLPILTMEFAIGRGSQKSPVYMYQTLNPEKKAWGAMGYICLAGNLSLMAFYTVVAGWIIYYFTKFITGSYSALTFEGMITNPKINIIFLFITIIISFSVLCFKIHNGVEKVTKSMMIALLFLIIILAVHSLTLPGAKEGIKFYLIPDFSKINGSVIVAAMNQAFFTLSIGIGSMAIFGSYIDKNHTLLGESMHIISLDTIVALIAGVIIFPACFTYNLQVEVGPSLLFDTMISVFNNMNGGRWWGTLFFLFMVFAALSTVLGVCENIVAMFKELTGLSRPLSCLICGAIVFALAITTALGFSILKFQPFSEGSTWLDFWDFIVSTNILPVGSFAIAVFCCYKIGWSWDNFMLEANAGKGPKVKKWMRFHFQRIVPVAIILIYIYGLITFKWR